MPKSRLEAFSDGVIAIIITIMVLEMKAPHGTDLAALRPMVPIFLSYILSFVYLAIYWNNHHHLLHAAKHVNARIMWANMHLLFWLSLIPFATDWLDESLLSPWPAALYGFVLLMAGFAYNVLQRSIIHAHGHQSSIAAAIGRDHKGKFSLACYAAAIGLAFVSPVISNALFILVALVWVVPDRRVESIANS